MSPEEARGDRSLGATAVLVSAVAIATVAPMPPVLVWNGSPSIREGLYLIDPWAKVGNGDLVLAWAPRRARILAAERLYLPAGVPLIKRVAASEGDRVCALGSQIRINEREAARRLLFDPSGRTMPWWSGCRKLGPGELFLLAPMLHSFDGRYFGTIGKAATIGKAVPL